MNLPQLAYLLGTVLAVAAAALAFKLRARLWLSKAKHPSLSGHSRIARQVAGLVPYYEYGDAQLFRSDDAPAEVAERRREGFLRLAALYGARFAETARLTAEAEAAISDLQFVATYRVPFQYTRFVRRHLQGGTFLCASAGVT
ncbi:MAG TPA: glutamate-1-semialdehyde 2,1-aminomutase, partial [Thermoanaerobaculia bacterium]|nr:glutamate-1-semialdehyde 2,1-aminomutase [Thermoanaerobaculia bacterium]